VLPKGVFGGWGYRGYEEEGDKKLYEMLMCGVVF